MRKILHIRFFIVIRFLHSGQHTQKSLLSDRFQRYKIIHLVGTLPLQLIRFIPIQLASIVVLFTFEIRFALSSSVSPTPRLGARESTSFLHQSCAEGGTHGQH